MFSGIGNLRVEDLGDSGQLAGDEVWPLDVAGGRDVVEVSEGLTFLDATSGDEDGVHISLAFLEEFFELGGDVEALGGSDGNLGRSGSEILVLFRGVDTGDDLWSEHADRFADAASAEHGTRILGPPRTGFGREEASELRILGGEADLAGVAVEGPEGDGCFGIELLPEDFASASAVPGEHGVGAHGERTADDVVLPLEIERGLAFSGALPSDELALFDLGASEHAG